MSWIGGKKALRDQIIARFPLEMIRYVEVFGGAGWVLFSREQDGAMGVFNDFNGDLVNLYRSVREKPSTCTCMTERERTGAVTRRLVPPQGI